MSNKKNKKKAAPEPSMMEKFGRLPSDKKRRLVIKGAVSLGVLGVAAGALSSYDKKNKELHDLTVIGAGKLVVVQVHDTSCPICRSLKSRVTNVLKDQDAIDYRVADITTSEGRAFQQKYNVQKTTLVLFDSKGRHVNTIVGQQSIETLEQVFASFATTAA